MTEKEFKLIKDRMAYMKKIAGAHIANAEDFLAKRLELYNSLPPELQKQISDEWPADPKQPVSPELTAGPLFEATTSPVPGSGQEGAAIEPGEQIPPVNQEQEN